MPISKSDHEPGLRECLRQVSGHSWRVFLICLIGVTFANLDHSLFTFVLTELAAEFGWSDLERGVYIAITFVVAGVLITQIGALADRLGRRAVLLVSTLLTPVFVTALAFAPTTVSLLIARTLGFTTSGVQSPVTGTLVFEESLLCLRGLFTGVLQIGFPLGFFLAFLLVLFIYETWGWRYIFLLSLLFLPYASFCTSLPTVRRSCSRRIFGKRVAGKHAKRSSWSDSPSLSVRLAMFLQRTSASS